jgi:hypothetical protein
VIAENEAPDRRGREPPVAETGAALRTRFSTLARTIAKVAEELTQDDATFGQKPATCCSIWGETAASR